MTTDTATASWAMTQMVATPKLRERRFDMLPLRGEGAVFTEIQGRLPGDSTTPAELSDLISSIETVGILQPVLVEEIPQPQGPPARRLATGERRLRAMLWGAVHRPDNPHFAELPAVVCPGPLSDEERRIWQIVENLAREPLAPGELAAALLLHRSAVLVGKLLASGTAVPQEIYAIADPQQRFEALEKLRGTDKKSAAPWAEVITRLGLQLTPRKARILVQAFRELPPELSEDFDEAKIGVTTRIQFAQLRKGREQAADDIWAAVKDRRQTGLLGTVIDEATHCTAELPADELIAAAEARRDRSNHLRSVALANDTEDDREQLDEPATEEPAPASPAADIGAGPQLRAVPSPSENPETVDPLIATHALQSLRQLAAAVHAGAALHQHDRASLQMLTEQILTEPSASTKAEAS